MLKREIRILIHGEFGVQTGFGTQAESIVDGLYNCKTEWGSRKFAPYVMALGLGMNPFDNSAKKPYPVIPMYGNRQAAPFGQDTARDLVQRIKPDIVLTFGDTWMINFWNDPNIIPPDLRKTFKLVGYTAIDGYPVPGFWVDIYKHFDKILTFTDFGKKAIEERAKQKDIKLDVGYIYHGGNPQLFRPLPQSDIDSYKVQRGLQGKKIIGMFSRNQPRKHHPEFVEFARELLRETNNDPNILFYFHCMESDAGWDLPRLIEDTDILNLRNRFEKYGLVEPGQEFEREDLHIMERFIFPGIKDQSVGLPKEHLVMLYNMCDAHVMLTSGEGWGLCASESLSCGVPTFTNDYAASAEFIKSSGGGEVIKARDYTYRGQDHNFFRPHTDYKDAVRKVMKVLNDPQLKKQYGKKGRAWAIGNSHEIIIDEWSEALGSMFKEDPTKEQKTEVL